MQNTNVRGVPCLISFEEKSGISRGGILSIQTAFEFVFYQGEGRAGKVIVRNPPEELGGNLLKALLITQDYMRKLQPPPNMTHVCPGVLDGGEKCGSEVFKVTVDRRLNGVAVLRLDCPKCKNVIVQDILSPLALAAPADEKAGDQTDAKEEP